MRKAEKEWSKPGENSSTAIKGGKRHDQKCQEKREPEVLIILKNQEEAGILVKASQQQVKVEDMEMK